MLGFHRGEWPAGCLYILEQIRDRQNWVSVFLDVLLCVYLWLSPVHSDDRQDVHQGEVEALS